MKMEVPYRSKPPKALRLKILTKDFGFFHTLPENYSQERCEEMVKMAEEIGDNCYKDDSSYSFCDDKGNVIVLNPFILRNSLYVVEVISVDLGSTPRVRKTDQ